MPFDERLHLSGALPKGCTYITHQCRQFKRAIEACVIEAHGQITLGNAALVQTAIRHETRAQLLQRWLRKEPDLTIEQRVSLIKELGTASDSRDRALAKLDLNRPEDNPFDQLGNVIDSLSPPADSDQANEPS